ncbi:MAG: hypothetical protein JNK15_09410 [Planctomycetes bacterium]|nr:hypothetical protein [Planctomycetota bacterium]
MAVLATVLAGMLAAGHVGPPPFHAVAFVNDPLSHGTVGDGLLSLNEAILLHNGQLAYAALSPAEQQQLSLIPGTGGTTDVTWIDIDAANTPVITIQQDLAAVLDTPFGLLVKAFGGEVVLDFSGPGLTRGLAAPANAITVEDIVFQGGPYGMDVTQTDVTGQAGCVLQGVRFTGQATFGLRVRALTANGAGRVILDQCEFIGCPTALQLDESGSGRTSIVELHDVEVVGAALGCEVVLGAGGFSRCTFDRVAIAASGDGLRIVRGVGADRASYLEGALVRVRAGNAMEVACAASGAGTWAVLRGFDLRSTLVGGQALRLGQPGDALFGELAEFTVEGSVAIGAGAGAQPLQVVNARLRNGAVALATTAAQAFTLRECRFDASPLALTGTGPVLAAGCCALAGSIAGSATAPLQWDGGYAAAVGPFVVVANPLPAPHLGSASITPEDPVAGGAVTFAFDLPPGLVGVFAVSLTPASGPALLPPFHVYCDPAAYVLAPGAYVLQQSFTWNLPAGSQFVGTDLVVQPVVLPLAGVPAPWLQLPPAHRFVLR